MLKGSDAMEADDGNNDDRNARCTNSHENERHDDNKSRQLSR